MYNVAKKNEILRQFTENADANLELVRTYGDIAEFMRNDDAEMVKYLIGKAVKAVENSVPSGIDVPSVAVYTSQNGDDNRISIIDLTIRNKYSSNNVFKFKKQIVYSEKVYDVLSDYLKMSWIELITDALIKANLDIVNEKLQGIGKEAGNDFTVKIVSPLGCDGRKVVNLTDEEIVYVADESRILDMDDILLFCEPTEFVTQEMIDKEYEATVARFAKAQTSPQFLAVHEPLIGHICDINKLVKPSTIIKKVYSKNVQKLRSSKDTMAYFAKDKVFAVVSVTKEGKDVVLKPFNIDTLEVVDLDVLKEI